MEIRYAKRKELRQAAAFINDCWQWAYKDILDAEYLAGASDQERYKHFREAFKRGRRPLLLFDNGELLGFCSFGNSLAEAFPDDGYIAALYLREDAVGKGYGHALLTRAEEELRAQGYRNLVLDVLSQNTRAIAFYLAHGYVKVGESAFTLPPQCGSKEYPKDIMRKAAT